jgi:hypothetical protein
VGNPNVQRIRTQGRNRDSRTRGDRPPERTTVKYPPSISIGRAVQLSAANEEWRPYLEKFGRVNRHLPVKNLGGMACTYVQASELNPMLERAHPRDYETREGINLLHEGFVTRFQTFVNESLRRRREDERLSTHAEVFGRHEDSPILEFPEDNLQDLWSPARAKVGRHLKVAGAYSLVFDLTKNDALAEEIDGVFSYLQNVEGLNLNLLHDRHRKPHVTVVRTEHRPIADAGVQILPNIAPPHDISLGAPTAWAESHTVPVASHRQISQL